MNSQWITIRSGELRSNADTRTVKRAIVKRKKMPLHTLRYRGGAPCCSIASTESIRTLRRHVTVPTYDSQVVLGVANVHLNAVLL